MMKTRFLFLSLPFLVVLLCICARVKRPNIDGAWKLVECNRWGASAKAVPMSADLEEIKLIVGNRFSWTLCDKPGNTVYNGASGTFSLEGGRYIEKIESGLPGMRPFVGTEADYAIEVKGNPMRIDGKLAGQVDVVEVWEKID